MKFSFYMLCLLVAAAYISTAISYWQLFIREEQRYLTRSRLLLLGSLGLHGLLLVFLAWINQRYPFAMPGEWLLFCSWLVAVAHLATEYFSRSKSLGLFSLLPIIAGVIISIFLVEPVAALPDKFKGAFFSLHIVTSLTAFACFTIAAILSAMYILLFRKLKSKDFDIFSAFMILAPIIGRMWVQQYEDSGMSPRELGIFIVLFFFLSAALGRNFLRFRGVRFAMSVIVGFVLLLLTQVLKVHGF
jgi:ABC-type uncharacterized transport system permease subunit